jgi:fluoride exporter
MRLSVKSPQSAQTVKQDFPGMLPRTTAGVNLPGEQASMAKKMLLVMIGGSIGVLSRYGVSQFAGAWFGGSFPWGTLMVNLAGCLLIGLSFALADRTPLMGPSVRLFFVTGFLGGMTTFSTYAWETAAVIQTGANLIATANFLLNNFAGMGLVLLGMGLGRIRLGKFYPRSPQD